MIRSRYASAIALAAFLAAPAFAQDSNSTPGYAQEKRAATTSTTTAAPHDKVAAAQQAASDQGRKPLCSQMTLPAGTRLNKESGRLIDGTTGKPLDCLPDNNGVGPSVNPNASAKGQANQAATSAKHPAAKKSNVAVNTTPSSITATRSGSTPSSSTSGTTYTLNPGVNVNPSVSVDANAPTTSIHASGSMTTTTATNAGNTPSSPPK